jgi:taurine--2-oxoglutarate transaminase
MEEQLICENPESVAAIWVETVTGTNGIIPPTEGYMQGLRALCDKYGILLVCDEVMCGFGRTGSWFAVEQYDVVPDILVMAKGITSAYLPVGCVAFGPELAAKWQDQPFLGGLTYHCHPMGLAAAIANIEVMEEEDLVGNSKRMGKVLGREFAQLKTDHSSVGDVRNVGLFGAVELVKNRETKEPMDANTMGQIQQVLRKNGISAFAKDHILMANPPLCIDEDTIVNAMKVFDEALAIADQNTN